MLTGPLFMLQIHDRVLTSRSEAGLQARMDARVLGAILARTGCLPASRSASATGLADEEAMQRLASGPDPFAFFDASWNGA